MRILQWLKRIVFLPSIGVIGSPGSSREIENDDAAASAMGAIPAEFPPNYVRPVDEGRPRH
jgi:hypothetical protein